MAPFPLFLKLRVSKSEALESMSPMNGFVALARPRVMSSRERLR